MICKMIDLQRHDTGSVFGCNQDKATALAYCVAQSQDGVPPFVTGKSAMHTKRSIFAV